MRGGVSVSLLHLALRADYLDYMDYTQKRFCNITVVLVVV